MPSDVPPRRKRPARLWFALAAPLLAFCWQAVTVHVNYGGGWTGLFLTGDRLPPPAELSQERIYIFKNSPGFDGQWFHYMAHDPFMLRGFHQGIDAARMRYRRILLPLMAWLLAGGQDAWVHATYIAVGLLFVFLGALWTSEWAQTHGRHPAWGLAFLALPASITLITRMTVDGALAALTVGFACLAARSPGWRLYVLLGSAALVRETGFLLIAAYGVYCLVHRRWRSALWTGLAGMPALAWYAFVYMRTGEYVHTVDPVPLRAIFTNLFQIRHYPPEVPLGELVRAADALALAGAMAAMGLAVWLVRRQSWTPVSLATVFWLVFLAIWQNHDAWSDVHSFGRLGSPLLALLGLGGLAGGQWHAAVPIGMMLPRLALQLSWEFRGVLSWIWSSARATLERLAG